MGKDCKQAAHPSKPGYVYDPELSDDITAGFTDDHGEQTYVKRDQLPSNHPEAKANFKKVKESTNMNILKKIVALQEAAQAEEQAGKKLDAYETVLAILDNKLNTAGSHPVDSKQHVQCTLLGDEDNLRLFYCAIYNAEPTVTEIEAYVLFNKKTRDVSFYDHHTREIYIDGKHIGSLNDTELLDKFVDEYRLESGKAGAGACEAYYDVLKAM